ncbi:hypothetical protein SAMN06295905_3527 [Devosia lucknowensis]|uniref:DUF2125 domain-containing protein n=1 Tax=Devosia lucknowensis TaxID=1096929 RepID=A0A1Y6GA15_9HYPH|nr:hypothetical protein [Devosia lucknowensis]SMQ86223.1 hypothetical protein SAMN06295905_3527 [Devosia lucknowensis]
MPRRLATLFAIPLLLPAMGHAQGVGEPAPLRDCRALLKLTRGELIATPDTSVEDVTGGCRFTCIGFVADFGVRFDVEEMILLSPNLLEVFPRNETLVSADLTLNGFSVEFAPQQKLDLQLVYTTEPDALTAELERVAIDAGELGRFEISASLSEFDNTALDMILAPDESGRIHDFRIALEDNGIVDRLLGPLFIGTDKSVIKQQIGVSTLVRDLPEQMISMASAEAIVRFITALPEPTGNWSLEFESAGGLPLNALNSASALEFLASLPADAAISATADYRP